MQRYPGVNASEQTRVTKDAQGRTNDTAGAGKPGGEQQLGQPIKLPHHKVAGSVQFPPATDTDQWKGAKLSQVGRFGDSINLPQQSTSKTQSPLMETDEEEGGVDSQEPQLSLSCNEMALLGHREYMSKRRITANKQASASTDFTAKKPIHHNQVFRDLVADSNRISDDVRKSQSSNVYQTAKKYVLFNHEAANQ